MTVRFSNFTGCPAFIQKFDAEIKEVQEVKDWEAAAMLTIKMGNSNG
jgi:hypothetical protein